MGHDALKLELIEWLAKLEDEETIGYLKLVKDADVLHEDWRLDLTDEQKSGIASGLKDVDEGKVTTHDIISKKYGL